MIPWSVLILIAGVNVLMNITQNWEELIYWLPF